MSKAILILDKMPERCGNCPLLQQWYDDEYKKRFDMCFWRYCKIEDTEGKLNVCPLKPIPYKRTNYVMYENATFVSAEEQIAYLCGYEDGWNDCINELVGEEE